MPLVLKDGATLFSYGDYAEVDGQIAFLLPFDDADAPRVEAVVVGTSSIDRDATTRATDSVRAARYTITRAPADFANLTDEVSAILNAVPSQADPVARVKMVEGARQRLVEWPAQHYDYRARDISDAVGLLDPILNELRAAAGVPRVDVTLSAGVAKAPRTIAVQPPTLVDLLENAMRVVALITPSQRTSVLRATTESLRRHRPMLPAVWFRTVERRVAATLRNETRLDVAYDKLSRDILSRAMRAASAADVRAISSLQAELTEADRKLGGQREDIVYSTMTGLQDQFNIAAAARLRLDREAMELSPR